MKSTLSCRRSRRVTATQLMEANKIELPRFLAAVMAVRCVDLLECFRKRNVYVETTTIGLKQEWLTIFKLNLLLKQHTSEGVDLISFSDLLYMWFNDEQITANPFEPLSESFVRATASHKTHSTLL